MAKSPKPTKFLNLKLISKFLADYKRMPYKAKSAIMGATLVVLLIPLALVIPLNLSTSQPLDLAPLEPAGECYITGCADHLCLDVAIDTPVKYCDSKPEYQCLIKARCERQSSGRCGWTETEEYLSCLSTLSQ